MVRGGRRRRRLNSASPCDQAVVLRNREPPLKQDSCLCLLLSKKRVAARKLQEPCAAKWATACPARREHPRHIQGVWWPTERDASGKHLSKLFLCPRVWAYFTRAYGDRVWSFYGIFALLTENIYIPASFFYKLLFTNCRHLAPCQCFYTCFECCSVAICARFVPHIVWGVLPAAVPSVDHSLPEHMASVWSVFIPRVPPRDVHGAVHYVRSSTRSVNDG